MSLDRDKLQEIYKNQNVEMPKGHRERFASRINPQASRKSGSVVKQIWLASAAAAAVVIMTFFFFGEQPGRIENSPTMSLSQVSDEMSDFESYYSSELDKRSQELVAERGSDPQVQAILTQLEELEKNYNELKRELGYNRNNEHIIRAMIDNYRLRLTLLERLMKENIQEKNQSNHENA